jgi:hypothetical protein
MLKLSNVLRNKIKALAIFIFKLFKIFLLITKLLKNYTLLKKTEKVKATIKVDNFIDNEEALRG